MHGLGEAVFPGNKKYYLPTGVWLPWFDTLVENGYNLHFNITGGEPTAHPDFRYMIETLDQKGKSTFDICSNMSYEPTWISKLEHINLLWCSLHNIHNQNWVDKFCRIVEECRQNNDQLRIVVNIVEQEGSKECYEKLKPWTKEHRLGLRYSLYDASFKENQIDENSQRRAMCSAGRDLLCAWPDGYIYRCFGHAFSKHNCLGHIQDGFLPSKNESELCEMMRCGVCDLDKLSVFKNL